MFPFGRSVPNETLHRDISLKRLGGVDENSCCCPPPLPLSQTAMADANEPAPHFHSPPASQHHGERAARPGDGYRGQAGYFHCQKCIAASGRLPLPPCSGTGRECATFIGAAEPGDS
jgi:hypothetical protein